MLKPPPFTHDRRGTAALEFAMVLPLLLLILAGLSEASRAIDAWRKITLAARTVADLTSQGDTQNPLSTGLMNDIFAITAPVMRPFDASGVTVVVSALGVDPARSTLVPQVCSSVAFGGGTARAVGPAADLTVPPGYQSQGMRYLLVEMTGRYTPLIGTALVKLVDGFSDTVTLSASVPWPIRGGQTYGSNTVTEIVLPGASPKACDGSTP
ncbi:TadE/TadG family type IV pilus assembly protein [Methylobacterium aquaticum]|uniref:TadE/TadG family type IV pilus assembly protein n=1 Tax=Methylobacterium aquaticum TaxID=270351 RepID=UPI003D7C1FDA